MNNTGELVILDASFVRNEKADGLGLENLAKCGCRFVMIDTLPYELCTSEARHAWPAAQRKLMPQAAHLDVWMHTAEMLKWEVENNQPLPSPVDSESTQTTREWFASGQVYVPDNLEQLAAPFVKQRETDTVQALLSDCEKLKKQVEQLSHRVTGKPYSKTMTECREFVNSTDNIRVTIERNHGDAEDGETSIDTPAADIGHQWFAFHHAKECLALLCLYVHKFGTEVTPDRIKDIDNTVLDANYAACLGFADVLATNETKDLFRLAKWMYGDSKRVITVDDARSLTVPHEEIALAAYQRWTERNYEHGHDVDDWLKAEKALYRQRWLTLTLPEYEELVEARGSTTMTNDEDQMPVEPVELVKQYGSCLLLRPDERNYRAGHGRR